VEKTSIVATPGAPGYDPTRLVIVRDYRIIEVFDLEPRHDAFAAERERDLTAALRDAADALSMPDAIHDLQVECRTATCQITLTTDASRMDELSAKLGLFPFADMVTPKSASDPDDPSRAFVWFTIAYEPESLNHDTFRARYTDLLTRKCLTRELAMAGVPADDFWKGDGS
jgi:hypothetical protein